MIIAIASITMTGIIASAIMSITAVVTIDVAWGLDRVKPRKTGLSEASLHHRDESFYQFAFANDTLLRISSE